MIVLRTLGAALVRALVLVALYAGFVVVLDRTDSDDALGAGLLYFLLVVGLALLGAAVDAARWAYLRAALVWLLAGAGLGLGVPLAAAALDPGTTGPLADEIRDGFVFLTLLVVLPALLGAAIGAVVRRARGR